MTKLGNVIEIFSATKESKKTTRPIVKELNMILDYGIENDKFAGKDDNKSVMIIGKNAYDIASKNGIKINYGDLGENILVDFNPHVLEENAIFTIGNTKLQITQSCTICKHLAVYDKQLPKLLEFDRGLYCKIVSSGYVKKDFEVYI